MHLDEALQEIGVGAVQRFAIFCCSFILFSEGFLSAGVFVMAPQAACDYNLPWHQLIYLYLPFLFGLLLGSLWLGGVSDVNGRRYTLGVSCVMCFIACIIASASSLLILFEIAAVVLGMSLSGVRSGCRILIFEMLPMKSRGAYMIILEFFSSLGSVLAIVWAYTMIIEEKNAGFFPALRAWRFLFFIGGLVCMLGSCFIGLTPFSPRQMLAHQRIVSVTILLRRFYAVNKGEHENSYPNYLLEPFLIVETRNYRRNQCSDYLVFICRCITSYIFDTFKWPHTMNTLFLIAGHILLLDGTILINGLVSEKLRKEGPCYLPLAHALNEKMMEQVCHNVNEPVYLFNVYLALTSLLSCLIIPLVIDRLPRNGMLVVTCLLTAASSFILAYSRDFTTVMIAGFALVFWHSSSLITLNIITLESFPTKYRSTAFGVLKFFAELALMGIIFSSNISCERIFVYLSYGFIASAIFSVLLPNLTRKPIIE